MYRACHLLLSFSMVGLVLSLLSVAEAQTWSLSRDFSTTNNPHGVWAYGSKTALNGTFDLDTDTAAVPAHYNTQQLAGWSLANHDIVPFVLKNVSSTDWVFGGVATLKPGEVMLHPYSVDSRYSVVRWTAPRAGWFSIDAQFTRFDGGGQGQNNYAVVLNGATLPNGSGTLVNFGQADSAAHYHSAALALQAGDTVDFAVGFGGDGTSNYDGTILNAIVRSVPTLFDISGDGKADILLQNAVTGQIYYWLLNGTNIASNGYVAPETLTGWEIVGTPDLDGSGQPDLLFQRSDTGAVAYWKMKGTASVGRGTLWSGGDKNWRVVGTPDLDADGQSDVLFQHQTTGQVYYWLLKQRKIGAQGYLWQGTISDWKVAAISDLNNDGYPDILLQNRNTGQVNYWLLNGVSIDKQGILWKGATSAWRVISSVDLNRDGQPDVLLQHQTTGQVYYWLLNNTTIGANGYIWSQNLAGWKIVGTDDYNRDGKPDILLQNQTTGKVYYWLLNGTTVAANGYLWNSNIPAWKVVAP